MRGPLLILSPKYFPNQKTEYVMLIPSYNKPTLFLFPDITSKAVSYGTTT